MKKLDYVEGMMNLYPVGGSLTKNNPFYVQRPADIELYSAIRAGQFCYVFNSRQMGKSSLLVRSQHQLEQDGFRCCIVDLTGIGSETITPQQWYKGVIFELWRGFQLRHQFNIRTWWQEQSDLSFLQRLQHFISEILLVQFSEPLVIFIDEIDSILSLPFTVDDFFALIRFCYNQRVVNPLYNRISFVLAGVATPADLIQDKQRTPFNIGTAIELTGFDYHSAMPLLEGLKTTVNQPDQVLKAIIYWTGGQPFLTQKLCQLVVDTARHCSSPRFLIPPGTEALWVSTVVRDRILHHWESQDEPEHLRTIRDRLESSSHYRGRLLGLYQQILQTERIQTPMQDGTLFPAMGLFVPATDSREQTELLLTGLIIKHQGFLRVKNRIYQRVFDQTWVNTQLARMRPYSQSLDAWIASSKQDISRLLRGQALQDAQQWAQGKTLSDRDYQFLAASQECDRQEAQQALEAARLQEVEARLWAEQQRRQQERKARILQQGLLLAVSIALLIALLFGNTLQQQYQTAIEREQWAKVREIRALTESARGLFASNQKLDALIAALKARAELQSLSTSGETRSLLQEQIEFVLQQAISGADEYNRFSYPPVGRYGLAISPDGRVIVTSGQNNSLHLWARNGQHLRTLEGHVGPVMSLAVSPTGDRMVSGSSDRTIRLWQLDGTFFHKLEGHQGSILTLAFSPDGRVIASGSDDATLRLWRQDGTPLHTLVGHRSDVLSVCFTPSGEILSGSDDGTIKRWSPTGELKSSFQHGGSVLSIAVNPQGNRIVTASDDQTVKVWTLDGTLVATLRGHTSTINAVAFSSDGQLIASASSDRTLKLWTTEGQFLKTFAGHTAPVDGVVFAPQQDGSDFTDLNLISLARDNTVRFWRPDNQLLTAITAHTDEVLSVAFSPDGANLASASSDKTIRLWHIYQENKIQITPHQILRDSAIARVVVFSPDGQLATADAEHIITLWTAEGKPQISFRAHNSTIRALTFSPNGRWLASASTDSTIKIWDVQSATNQPPPLVATLTGHQSGVFALAFRSDSRVLASASSDSTVRLWAPDGRPLNTLRRHQLPVWAIAFNPLQNVLASAGEDKTILLWQSNGMILNMLKGHEDIIRALDFSPNGLLLASGSQDGVIKLWQANGTLLTTLKGHRASITSLKFSPDSQLLASTGEDNTVLLWNLENVRSRDQIIRYTCNWVKDYIQTNLNQENASDPISTTPPLCADYSY